MMADFSEELALLSIAVDLAKERDEYRQIAHEHDATITRLSSELAQVRAENFRLTSSSDYWKSMADTARHEIEGLKAIIDRMIAVATELSDSDIDRIIRAFRESFS